MDPPRAPRQTPRPAREKKNETTLQNCGNFRRHWTSGLFRRGLRSAVRGVEVECLGCRYWIAGFGFRVSCFWFRVAGFGVRDSEFGFRVSVFGFRVSGFGFRMSGFGVEISGFEFRNSEFGIRFPGFEFRVSGFGSGVRVSGSRFRVADEVFTAANETRTFSAFSWESLDLIFGRPQPTPSSPLHTFAVPAFQI